jgi:quinol monooxygenase YgiN
MTQTSGTEIEVVATLTAKPGQRQDVVDALSSIIAAVRQEPGCSRYDLHLDLDHPDRVVMLETWASTEALAIHGQGEALKSLADRLPALLAGPVDLVRLTHLV